MSEREVRLAVSAGCPCGVGPEVSVAAARMLLEEDPAVRVALHGDEATLGEQLGPHGLPPRLELVATSSLGVDERRPGRPGAAAGLAQLAAIDRAADAVMARRAVSNSTVEPAS